MLRWLYPELSFSSRQGLHELRLQLAGRLCDLGEELFVFGQEVAHVAGAGVGVVRVLDFEHSPSFSEDVVFLTAPGQARDELISLQQQTQTSRPFTKTFLLPAMEGVPDEPPPAGGTSRR